MNRFSPLVLLLMVLGACSKPAVEEQSGGLDRRVPPGDTPMAVVAAGGGTLSPEGDAFWFELAAGGPRLIASPGEASLVPFEPWKASRYICGFLAGPRNGEGTDLIAGINRGGFLIFRYRQKGEIALYYYNNPAWDRYTAASLFWYGGMPAALLCRDRVFTEGEIPLPVPAVWTFNPKEPKPEFRGLAVPAFAPLEGCEIEGLLWGRDGDWYYRGLSEPEGGIYYRSPSLYAEGGSIPPGAYLEAALPLSPDLAPPLLAAALEDAAGMADFGISCNAVAVSRDFPARRVFTVKTASAQADLTEISAYYCEGLALVLFPDGRGIFKREAGGGGFALPALPEDFVYTGIARGDDGPGMILVASWEEQQDWNIGAAGFLMLEMNF